MSAQLTTSLESLKRCIATKRPRETKKYVEIILNYFQSDDLTETEIDLAIQILFNETNGTIVFLKKSLYQNKIFKDANIDIFALYRNLIINYKTKVSPYAREITECVLNFIMSSSASAKEKEMSITIIQELVANKISEKINVTILVENLLIIFTLKDPTARFLQLTLELVGLLTKDYPECFSENQILNIRDVLFNSIESPLLKQEKFSFVTIAGALKAFDYFYYNFSPNVTEEPLICQRFYNCIKNLSDPMESKDRAAFRCALNLISHHGTIISIQLFNDHFYWHKLFQKWLQFSLEDRKCAIYAIHSFHQEISQTIEKRKNPDDNNILKFFIDYFKKILVSPTSKSYEIRIAIRGFGVMAAPCKTLLPPEYLTDLLTLVMQRTEYTYYCDKTQKNEMLEHLPDFVQALSQIMGYVTELSGIQITTLENIIVSLIKDFHFLSTIHHELVVTSLITTFYNLSLLGGTILDDLLKKIILQGVIWTCTNKLSFDVDWNLDWKENITYKSYLPLWNGLLNMNKNSDIDRPMIVKKFYDHFINTLIIILDKINLKTTKRTFKDDRGIDQELFFCDPNIDLNPVNPKDFHIFFNLIDLYKDVLKSQTVTDHKENFEKWINILTDIIIKKYYLYPLISGFLKLLGVILRIGDSINFFTDDLSNIRPDLKNLNINVSQFLKIIISRSQQTSGELQISCLLLIFKSPMLLLQDYVKQLCPVFIIAFDIGKSMLWLASYALHTLQKLNQTILSGSDEQLLLLKEVLPCLDTFLLSKGFTEKTNYSVEIVKFRTRKIAKKSLKTQQSESELKILQKEIILFLGTLEPQNCLHLLESVKKENLIKWDVSQKIRLTLDAYDMKPTIYLDTLLPRVCELALTSSDRKTKIAACELLHGTVLYLIGTNNHTGNIWSEICEKIFYLGCDTDTIVQEMFEPLLIQLMHYLSQSSQLNNPGVKILLNCIMNLISHPSNCAIRDLSVRCLREYLMWAIKQTTPEQLKGSPFRIDSIIIRLSTFSFDSNSNKRYGACLAFNNIYRVLREEESIIDQYWLELLYIFCTNFIMSEEFSNITTDLEQISITLDHLARVLCERSDIFERININRPLTIVYTEVTLKGAVIWLFKQCGAKQLNYRRKCMEIFLKITRNLKNYESSAKFIEETFTLNDIIEICEGNENGTGIAGRRNLIHIQESKLLPIVFISTWLQHLLTSLDCYTWLISENLIINLNQLMENSHIYDVIIYYINNLCWSSVYDIIDGITSTILDKSTDTYDLKIGGIEIDKIMNIKCKIIIMIMNLIIQTLNNCPKIIPTVFWQNNNTKLIKLISDMIFKPHELGIDIKTPEILEKLPTLMENLLNTIKIKGPNEFHEQLTIELLNELTERLKYTTDNVESQIHIDLIDEKQLNSVKGIELILRTITIKNYNLQLKFILISSEKLIYDLFYGLTEKILQDNFTVIPKPAIKRYLNLLIGLCFYVNDFYKILIDLILNNKILKQTKSDKTSTIKHGEYFIEIYRLKIFEHLLKTPKLFMELLFNKLNDSNSLEIIKFLSKLTEYIHKYKINERGFLINYIDIIFNHWPKIFEQIKRKNGVELNLIEFMSHVAMASPYHLYELGTKAVNFTEWLNEIITNKNVTLELKSRALFLVPCITGPNDYDNLLLTQSLNQLQIQHFPLKSSEFPVDSLERTGFVAVFRSLLDALIVSKSPILLKFLINATSADQKHILEYQIQESLINFMKNKKIKHQLDCMNIIFEIFNNINLEPTIRAIVMKRFLIIIIRGSYVNAIIDFYKENIKKIIEMTNTNYNGRGWEVERDLITRTGGYQLIEILFAVIPKNILSDKDCSISKAHFGENMIKTGKELFGDLMKRSFKVRSEIFVTDDLSASELFRKYQCAAYNSLCTIICNSQDELKFYNTLIFKENQLKNEYVWRNIINIKDEQLYKFLQDFDEYPKLKDRIVSIRYTAHGNKKPENNVKYLESVNVFDSSLSQDITKLDLTNSYVRTNDEVNNMIANEKTENINTIRLENMPLNEHEVMATLCAVINHMYDNKITPIHENITEIRRTTAPLWIESICTVLTDQNNHKNIRLFLAKIIDNCRHIFRNYAGVLLRPIMQLITDECAGNTLNSFITDLIAMLLSWNEICSPETHEELQLASALLKFLMKNCYHQRKEIFKLNLELIKNLIEIWKHKIHLPIQFLFDSINQTTNLNSIDNITGIHLNAIVLANDLVPWTNISKIQFITSIFNCINNELTAIYQPASQLIGMCLLHLYPINDNPNQSNDDDDPCLKELLQNINLIRRNNEKKFMDILFGVQKYYPKIMDTFISLICHNIPTSVGIIKRKNLEMLLGRFEILKTETFRELISIDIVNLLKQNEYQLLGLHLINKGIQNMSTDEIDILLNDICSFTESKKSICRDVMYEILIFIHEKNDTSTLKGQEIIKRASTILLIGLNDQDSQIQNRIFNFWSNEIRLPKNLSERLSKLLGNLFDINSEKQFLGYSTQLLLEPIIHNPISKRQIFEHQTEHDHKFTEYKINTNWQSYNSTIMSPLFIESQQKQLISGDCTQMTKYLRATQTTLMFEPTQDPLQMTQTQNNFTLPTQSSLLFDIQPQMLNRRSEKMTTNQQQQQQDNNVNKEQDTFERFRTRFIRDKDKIGKAQALKAIDRNQFKQIKQSQEMKRKEREVNLYRRYRIGDHPDLLINSLALLLPLQGLVKRDSLLARQVFVALFNAITNESTDKFLYIRAISQSIEHILNTTKSCEPTLFGALMEIALNQPQIFTLTPDLISVISNGCNMMPSGILFIESHLDIGFDDTNSLTKSSSSLIDDETNHWLKLSEMYFALTEIDIVTSIYSDKIKSNPALMKGISLQSEGNFIKAQQEYMKIIETVQCTAHERDFCYQSFYDCFLHMGNWKDLTDYVQQQVNNIDELWSDNFNQENFLPHYIHAELRLLLEKNVINNKFLQTMELWLKNNEKLDYLIMNNGEELMLLEIANQEYRQAKVYSEKCLTYFLSEWNQLNIFSKKLRANKLLNMCKVAEIHQYINLIMNDITSDIKLEKLWQQWINTNPKKSDSIILLDCLICYRNCITDIIIDNLPVDNNYSDKLQDSIYNMNFKLLDVVAEQNYINLYEKIIIRLSCLENKTNDKRSLEWKIARSKLQIIKSKSRTKPIDSIALLLKAWERISLNVLNTDNNQILKENPDIHIKAYDEISQISQELLNFNSKDYNFSNEEILIINQFSTINQSENFIEQLYNQSLLSLKQCVNIAEQNQLNMEPVNYSNNILAETHFKVAEFCYDIHGRNNIPKTIENEKNIVTSVLRAMQFNSKEARQMFPCLLQLPAIQNEELGPLFNEEIKNIPEWMFLDWTSQILSIMNFNEKCYLDPLILRMANSFPTALKYPFRLSFEQYLKLKIQHEDIDDDELITHRVFINQLNEILKNPLIDLFIENITNLCLPTVKLKHHMNKLHNFIVKNPTKKQYQREVKNIIKIIYSFKDQSNKMYELIHKEKENIEKLLEFNPLNETKQIIDLIKTIIKNIEQKKHPTEIDTVALCPWLGNFKWFGDENYLELPGQYNNNNEKRPNIQSKIKIFKFDEKIQIFKSLRRPIKLKIYGDNGKTYDFLVKYGEDIRQDQRIQRLFLLMSKQMEQDKNCRNHNLKIPTYNVIPINCYCGMLSWVKNTDTLSNFIEKNLNDYDNKFNDMQTKYAEFLNKNNKLNNLQDIYGKAVIKYNRIQIITNFKAVENLIPANTLKSAIYNIAVSPETFYAIRNNYATTLAINSIAHWILGIGDRHLSNFLLNNETGSIIGIDFGCSFGAGLRDLVVPELIPFRLTSQLVNVMNPMGVSGILTKCMIHSLRCFRSSIKLLMSCMEVFINEPTIDWLEMSRNFGEMGEIEGIEWNAKNRINIAFRKLNGENPCTLSMKELSSGIHKQSPAYLNRYMKLLAGVEQFNIRARLPKKNLTVEEQVQVLIDLATDPALLGVMYFGFKPYF